MGPVVELERERHLRVLASAKGIRSIRQLARTAHLGRNALRLSLHGDSKPRAQTLAKLAEVLGVAPDVVARIFGAGAR